MNFKACTFERLALIFGFGRGAQVGKTSLLEVNLYGASVDVGRIHFLFGTLQVLGSHQISRYLEENDAFSLTMRSKDSETAHILGSGPVLRHNNACVRDVLTAPSNVYLNLGLNLFHSYF